MIIGLSGFKSCGKDTVASIFKKNGYITLSMADPLKDMVAALFGWDRQMVEGVSHGSRQWREQPLKEWQCLAGSGVFKADAQITPRIVLQRIGTDLFRQHIRDDFWILCLKNRVEQLKKQYMEANMPFKGVVIKDARFSNELSMCDITIRIDRFTYTPKQLSQMHISETAHLEHTFDYSIDNTDTLPYLNDQVYRILKEIDH